MESIARMMVAAIELVEAEGRVLKQQVIRVCVAIGLAILVAIFAMIGVGFLVAAIFLFLKTYVGPAGAAAIMGVAGLAMGIGGGLFARKLLLPAKKVADQHAKGRDLSGETSREIEEATLRAEAHTARVPLPTGERLTPETSYATR